MALTVLAQRFSLLYTVSSLPLTQTPAVVYSLSQKSFLTRERTKIAHVLTQKGTEIYHVFLVRQLH